MTSLTRALDKPRLIFETQVERRHYWRRFRRSFIIAVCSLLAWVALHVTRSRGIVGGIALDIGWLVAMVLFALSLVKVVVNLTRWRTRPNEAVRLFTQGFAWERNGAKHQYSWNKLRTFREGGRGIYFRKQPLIQWGALTLTMADGSVFKFMPRHGNLQQIARIIHPYAAEVTGIRMGRRLRQEKPVRVHPALVVWPGGLQVGKKEYPWQVLSVGVKRNKLVIRAKENGKVRTVRRYNIHSVDNLGGFVELATTTIQTHRP